jgi:TolA-binding protein
MSSHLPIVKQAAEYYRQGQYDRAHQLYLQAASRYGSHLFKANLALCQRRISSAAPPAALPAASAPVITDESSERQLAETQKLLEQYFARCQELEHQLMDR